MTRRLKMGMVGGGREALIGNVHRMAVRLDGGIELVAGAFSSDPEKARRSGEDLFLDPQRVYPDYQTMVQAESKLPAGHRIDFVSVVTPNHLHYPVAKAFLEAGFNVVCDNSQGWLLHPLDLEGQKQAAWRTDPQRAGASSCIGDIGTHAENLARYVTGLEIEELCADFSTLVEGRQLE